MNELSSLLVAAVAQFKGIRICSVCSDRTEVNFLLLGEVHDSAVGIDVGAARFATMSNGSFNTLLASPRKHTQRLTQYERYTEHKVKGACNWKKAKIRVLPIHARIAHARSDLLHKASNPISEARAIPAVEDMKTSNMLNSTKGTESTPGLNVRAKAGSSKSILDQGWGEFLSKLEYRVARSSGYCSP